MMARYKPASFFPSPQINYLLYHALMKNLFLWQKLEAFQLDDPEAGFSLSDRLARENAWPMDFTHRVILEYKRFLYLCAEAGHPLTPSDEVDQAWHLHLCYTQSYWEDLCEQTLAKKIHHGPTKGGVSEREKFNHWYDQTLKSYREEFNVEPPKDIWPESKVRFGKQRFQRIDTIQNLILPKKWLLAGCGDSGCGGGGCGS